MYNWSGNQLYVQDFICYSITCDVVRAQENRGILLFVTKQTADKWKIIRVLMNIQYKTPLRCFRFYFKLAIHSSFF